MKDLKTFIEAELTDLEDKFGGDDRVKWEDYQATRARISDAFARGETKHLKYQADVPYLYGRHDESSPEMIAYLRENERINRWHQTYNAAVTGLSARSNLGESVHRMATELADIAHGTL